MNAKSLSIGQFQRVDTSALIQRALSARVRSAAAAANESKASFALNRPADSVQLSSAATRSAEQIESPEQVAPSPIKLEVPVGNTPPVRQSPQTIITAPVQDSPATKSPSSLAIAEIDTPVDDADSGPLTTTSDPVRLYGDADLAAVQSAWGASSGDRAYNTLADANGDGIVNFDDQNFILASWGQAAPSNQDSASTLTGPIGQQHLDAAQAAFGAQSGDANFVQGADANGDGVIDFNDITQLLANWGQTPS